jgi:hypothetical protein
VTETFGLTPALRLTPEYFAFLERTVCEPAFRAAVPVPGLGAVTQFHLESSLAIARTGAGLDLSVEGVRGWTPDGRPVVTASGAPARCSVTPGTDGDYSIWVRLDPQPGEGQICAPRYELCTERAGAAPAPAAGVLDLGTVRVRGGRQAGFARRPAVSSFGAIGPWDDGWREWVRPLRIKIEQLIVEVDRLTGDRSRAFAAAVLELARVWSELPVHELVAWVRWLGRLRTEPAAMLSLPHAEPAFALPADAMAWPTAVAAELDAALPVVRVPDEPLIKDAPDRHEPVHEPAEVRFTPEGTKLRVDFLTDLSDCLALELRLPHAAAPAQLTYEYGRGSGSSTTAGEHRTGATGYPLPAPPRSPLAPPAHPPLFIWPVPPACNPQLLVTAR